MDKAGAQLRPQRDRKGNGRRSLRQTAPVLTGRRGPDPESTRVRSLTLSRKQLLSLDTIWVFSPCLVPLSHLSPGARNHVHSQSPRPS